MATDPHTMNPPSSSPERDEKIRNLVRDLDFPLTQIAECGGTLCHLVDYLESPSHVEEVMSLVTKTLDNQVCIARKIFAELHDVAVRGEGAAS